LGVDWKWLNLPIPTGFPPPMPLGMPRSNHFCLFGSQTPTVPSVPGRPGQTILPDGEASLSWSPWRLPTHHTLANQSGRNPVETL
jgi:hypothetical protein